MDGIVQVGSDSGSDPAGDRHRRGGEGPGVVLPESPLDVVVTTHAQPQQPPEVPQLHREEEDDLSGEMDREYNGVFEGPEKTLEVFFRKANTAGDVNLAEEQQTGRKVGLRSLCRRDLDRICSRARCSILSSVSNRYLDAYVLSESSLFVYPYMVVLKTCGTTTLLRCIATLIELGRGLGLEIDWVGYNRKNFTYPGDQRFPHESFQQELEYLNSHRNLCERLDGNGYTLGPVTSDHWFVFVADQTVRSKIIDSDTDRVLNVMMFDIDEDVAEIFRYDAYRRDDETEEETVRRVSWEQTKAAGIDALCPGAVIDPRAFEPCGYSMNAILFRSYSTVHITPEATSSYASFETNQRVKSYSSLINNVVRTFRPRRIVMTLMADEAGLKQMEENPLTDKKTRIVVPCGNNGNEGGGKQQPCPKGGGEGPSKHYFYKRKSLASISVEDDCTCTMANWVLENDLEVEGGRATNNVRADKLRGMSVS